jgi:hypothetical protein
MWQVWKGQTPEISAYEMVGGARTKRARCPLHVAVWIVGEHDNLVRPQRADHRSVARDTGYGVPVKHSEPWLTNNVTVSQRSVAKRE